MKDIKFIKDYYNDFVGITIPAGTVLKFKNGKYEYSNNESHVEDGWTFKSTSSFVFNDSDAKKIIAKGFAVEMIDQDTYENKLMGDLKPARPNYDQLKEQNDKLKEQLNALDARFKKAYDESIDIDRRAQELLSRYDKRREELEKKMNNENDELSAYEYMQRAYICKSIFDAIAYVMSGKINK
jgi:vacuolar-type H+-ATPase subunit I/STV1